MRLLVLLLSLLSLATSGAFAQQRTLVEGIVVRVNERILTTADMRKRIAEREAETGATFPPESYPALVAEAADDLCLLERAEEQQVEASPEEVSAMLNDLREQNRAPDEETFRQMVTEMGLTIEGLRRRLRETILINRVLSREVGSLPVTDEELRQRYERDKEQFVIPERVHLEHMVLEVSLERGDEERKLAQARRLVAAARSGQELSKLIATEVEAGRGQGGDLGTVALTDLRDEVKEAIAELEEGEITEPFVSSAGVHVARVVERLAPSARPFEEVALELRQRELAERYRDRLRGVVDDLKKRYVVETYPERFTHSS